MSARSEQRVQAACIGSARRYQKLTRFGLLLHGTSGSNSRMRLCVAPFPRYQRRRAAARGGGRAAPEKSTVTLEYFRAGTCSPRRRRCHANVGKILRRKTHDARVLLLLTVTAAFFPQRRRRNHHAARVRRIWKRPKSQQQQHCRRHQIKRSQGDAPLRQAAISSTNANWAATTNNNTPAQQRLA